MRIILCEESNKRDWEELVEGSEEATTGHLWQWREIVASAYGFKSFYLMAEEDGKPLAVAPFISVRSLLYGNELASMPYLDYGGVCHSSRLPEEARPEVDRAIFDHALKLALSLNAKRLHARSPLAPNDPRFEISLEKVAQRLELAATAADQLKRLPAERRNRLRRCERSGLKTEIYKPTDPQALKEFYAVYSTNMRDLGSPTHSSLFFREVSERLQDYLTLIIIRYEGEPVAAALAFEFRKMIGLPWSGATLAARPLYGNNALFWAGISMGIERGCHTFDFGRSSVGSGIFEFKRQWGPLPHQAYWGTIQLRPGAKAPRERRELNMASAIWKRVPLSITRIVGPMLRGGISN